MGSAGATAARLAGSAAWHRWLPLCSPSAAACPAAVEFPANVTPEQADALKRVLGGAGLPNGVPMEDEEHVSARGRGELALPPGRPFLPPGAAEPVCLDSIRPAVPLNTF